jgi:hypothetical protein
VVGNVNEQEQAPAGRGKGTESLVGLTPLMKRIAAWGIWIGAGMVGISFAASLIYWTWKEPDSIKEILKEHFAATVGLPLAAVGSFLLVTALQVTAGKIEFEIVGLKFRGASGPIVLWVLVFLGMTVAIRLVW